jgi:hypothetical protein
MVRKEQHCTKLNTSTSLPLGADVDDVHLVWVSPFNPPFRGTLSSSMGVSMNTKKIVNKILVLILTFRARSTNIFIDFA